MSSLLSSRRRGHCCFLLVLVLASLFTISSKAFSPQGGEYPIAGQMYGDQVFPHVSVGVDGGYVVWQDNATDGDGSGISARRLGSDLLGALGAFRVNENGVGEQENARVCVLRNGGAVFVWQGGPLGDQDIFARFVGPGGTFVTGDLRVNTETVNQQINPAVAELANGNVVVVWSSFGQDGSLQGIFGQLLSSGGERLGAEFLVNQFTSYNQRNPAVAALENGSFVVAWVTEQKRFPQSVDICARVFGTGRSANGTEFLVNTGTNLCANPTVVAGSGDRFLVSWSERDLAELANGWDVLARPFKASGEPAGDPVRLNARIPGNQFGPQIARIEEGYMAVWTSVPQDGSKEGVFGRFLGADGSPSSDEFQVNTYAGSQQIHPAVCSDGVSRYLAVWTSFVGGATSFDLFGQRYAATRAAPAPPFVSALSSSRLSVTWPEAEESGVTAYEVYMDDATEPVVVTVNYWNSPPLNPASTHQFRLAYRYESGGSSLRSAAASGTTWGSDENLDGLPDDWQRGIWGAESSNWPSPAGDSDGDGATELQEFMAGTDPKDPSSVLRTEIVSTPQGSFLRWNTQPGYVYQVETSGSLDEGWTELGAPRFAAGTTDSVLIPSPDGSVYYRVKRLR